MSETSLSIVDHILSQKALIYIYLDSTYTWVHAGLCLVT